VGERWQRTEPGVADVVGVETERLDAARGGPAEAQRARDRQRAVGAQPIVDQMEREAAPDGQLLRFPSQQEKEEHQDVGGNWERCASV
jgi:hypothetical protein